MAEDNKTNMLLERALEYLEKDKIKELQESVEENNKRQKDIKEAIEAVEENDKMLAEAQIAAIKEDRERSGLNTETMSIWKKISENISGLYGIAKKDAMDKARSIKKSVTTGEFEFEEMKFGDAFDSLGLGQISKIIKDVGKTFKSLGPLLRNLGKLFLKFIVRPIFLLVTNVLPAIGAALLPFAPIILTAVAAIGAIMESVNFMKDEIDKGGNLIQIGIAAIIGAFTGAINIFLKLGDKIAHFVGDMFAKILGDDNPIVKFFRSFNVAGVFTDAMKGLTNFINHTIPEFFIDLFDGAGEWFTKLFSDLKQGAVDLWNGIKDAASSVKQQVLSGWQAVKDFFKPIGAWFTKLFSDLKEGAVDLWNGIEATGISIKEQFLNGWQSIKDFFSGIPQWFSDLFSRMKTAAVEKWESIKSLAESTKDKLVSGWQSIKDFFSPVAEWFRSLFSNLKQGASDLWTGIKATVTDIKDQFLSGWNSIKDFLSNIGQWFSDTFASIKEVASEKWESIKQFATDIGDKLSAGLQKIKDFFSGIPQWFESKFTVIEKAASDGLEGVTDLASKVTEIAKKIVKTPFDLVKKAFETLKEKLSWENIKSTVSDINPLSGIGSGIKEFAKNFARAAAEKFSFLKYVPGFKDLLEDDATPPVPTVAESIPESTPAPMAPGTGPLMSSANTSQDSTSVVGELLDAVEEDTRVRKESGNLGSALNPAPEVPSVRVSAPAPTGAIAGLERTAAAQTEEMTVRQQRLDDTKAESQYGMMRGGQQNNVIADNADYSTTTYNQVLNSPQPKTNDVYDPFLMYKSAGNSR